MGRSRVELWHELIRGDRRGLFAWLARCGLAIASWPYGIAVRTRNGLFHYGWKKASRTSVPVVSIGNLTLGGTGKTPCVEYVGRFYRDRDVRVTILSRGYGSETGPNDEALVLEENLPDVMHLQGLDRLSLANTAVEELETELVILDDGFQHRRLHRNLDVVLIDATQPPFRDDLFPRGTLREPASGLQRADVIVLTRCDQVSADELDALRNWIAWRCPDKPIAATEHRPVDLVGGEAPEALECLRDRPVMGFCGIGNPAAFRHTLQTLGADVVDFRRFADHHNYTRTDVEELTRWARRLPAGGLVATTQKDWVKLRVGELGRIPLRAVRIGLKFVEGQREFDEKLSLCIVEQEKDADEK